MYFVSNGFAPHGRNRQQQLGDRGDAGRRHDRGMLVRSSKESCMKRFHWVLGVYGLLGAAIAAVVTTWAISGRAQPAPAAPPSAFAMPFVGQPGLPLAAISFELAPPPLMFPDPDAPLFAPPPVPSRSRSERWAPAEMCRDMMARQAAFRTYLKVRVNLTPQQLAAWQDFENAASENERDEGAACGKLSGAPEDQTIIQRLDAAEQALGERLGRMRKVNGPLRKVIGMLSPDQRRLIDQVMMPMPGFERPHLLGQPFPAPHTGSFE
jgi:hypothetical protein